MRTKRIAYEEYMQAPLLPEAHSRLGIKKKLLLKIWRQELTPYQQELVYSYYFLGKNIPQIAREQGKNKSSVCRGLQRSRQKLQKSVEKYMDILQFIKDSP